MWLDKRVVTAVDRGPHSKTQHLKWTFPLGAEYHVAKYGWGGNHVHVCGHMHVCALKKKLLWEAVEKLQRVVQ